MSAAAQAELELAVKEYQGLQKDLDKQMDTRQKIVAQLHESEVVQKELEIVEPTGEVYKLIGPALFKQEQPMALDAVTQRVRMFTESIKTTEATIERMQKSMEEKRERLITLQQAAQASRLEQMKPQ
ncbi:putative prefoldin beta subunit [Paratrimastix pyriformis]|uniref:Prefoldin beta subunit n=1 Tax=Paratrimastix pyriformis TaxID=342808 RepID=A0ABQ8UU05_9EUKA|nr:putative prefoldin beta subunit [Paratrimastix pyriformis]